MSLNPDRSITAGAIYYYYHLSKQYVGPRPGLCVRYITYCAHPTVVKKHLPLYIQKKIRHWFRSYHPSNVMNEQENTWCRFSQSAFRIERKILTRYQKGELTRADAYREVKRSGHPNMDLIMKQIIRKMTEFENGNRLGLKGKPNTYVREYLRCGQFKQVLDHLRKTDDYTILQKRYDECTANWGFRDKFDKMLRRLLRLWKPEKGKHTIAEATQQFVNWTKIQLDNFDINDFGGTKIYTMHTVHDAN